MTSKKQDYDEESLICPTGISKNSFTKKKKKIDKTWWNLQSEELGELEASHPRQEPKANPAGRKADLHSRRK